MRVQKLLPTLIKLAIVALVANGVMHVMTAYMAHWRFVDDVRQLTQFGHDKTVERLKTRVLEMANDHDLPLGEDDFTLTRENFHTVVDGSYTQIVEIAPRVKRPWTFKFHTDTFSEAPITAK